MELLVSVQGLDKIERRFSRFEHKLADTRPVFMEMTEALAKSNEKNWGRGVQLADSTIAEKQRLGLPDEPLVATGRLKASLTHVEAEGAIREILPYEMRFGTSIFYARFQQYGTRTMPVKHRVLRVTPTVRKLLKGLLRTHLLGNE